MPHLATIFMGAMVLGAGLLSAIAVRRWPARWLVGLVWLLVLQNVAALALWKLTGSAAAARGLIFAKEAAVVGSGLAIVPFLYLEIRRRALPIAVWLALGYIALCLLFVPISLAKGLPLDQVARGFRSLAFPAGLLVIGCIALRTRDARTSFISAIGAAAVLVGISAIVERTLIPTAFWTSIRLEDYWIQVKGASATMFDAGLPWNFFAHFLGGPLRRAFGVMTDPLGLSYFLLLPLALSLAGLSRATSARDRLRACLVVGASLLGISFSLSRLPTALAATLALLIPLLVVGVRRVRSWLPVAGAAMGFLLLSLAVSVILASAQATTGRATTVQAEAAAAPTAPATGSSPSGQAPVDPSPSTNASAVQLIDPAAQAHLNALREARDWRRFAVGRGLGVVGPLAATYASSPSEGGYENVYLDTAAQIGLLGAVALVGILIGAAVSLLRRRGSRPQSAAAAVAVAMVFLLLALDGLLTSQLFVLTSLGCTWLFVGAVLGSPADATDRAESAI